MFWVTTLFFIPLVYGQIDCNLTTQACPSSILQTGVWKSIATDALNTGCIEGPYFFRVNLGTSGKLVFWLQGGGAIWDPILSQLSPIGVANTIAAWDSNYERGVFNRTHPENPFQNWTYVYVSYCTGDAHSGNGVATYPKSTRHWGSKNVRAVLNWVRDNLPTPTDLTLGGCSAGAIGSSFWQGPVLRTWPNARTLVVFDGYLTAALPGTDANQFNILRNLWKTCELLQGEPDIYQMCTNGTDFNKFTDSLRYRMMNDSTKQLNIALITGLLDSTQATFAQTSLATQAPVSCSCYPVLNASANATGNAQLALLANIVSNLAANYCPLICNQLIPNILSPPTPDLRYYFDKILDWNKQVLTPSLKDARLLDNNIYGSYITGGPVRFTHCHSTSTIFYNSVDGTNKMSPAQYLKQLLANPRVTPYVCPTDSAGLELPCPSGVLIQFNNKPTSPKVTTSYTVNMAGGGTISFSNKPN
eukprot:NODE_1329_length_2008_cov_58.580371_g1124_i0.p1 GENE.NODE_1329_length_2008_cov_58.580371_g1124_i0~~NODE_1329_length_2008_cov_58.580371_g1124_i0.p1  ORF type:complete len:474 (-),score=67.29 NODE_1329_length_2008_cov_58.580371_g1124_i0:536-1957(-)